MYKLEVRLIYRDDSHMYLCVLLAFATQFLMVSTNQLIIQKTERDIQREKG